MHDPTGRRQVAEPFADGKFDTGHSNPDGDGLANAVASADTSADNRAAERDIRHGRVGVRGWNASLPIVRPRRHVGRALNPAHSGEH
jgi:hypothetical protein